MAGANVNNEEFTYSLEQTVNTILETREIYDSRYYESDNDDEAVAFYIDSDNYGTDSDEEIELFREEVSNYIPEPDAAVYLGRNGCKWSKSKTENVSSDSNEDADDPHRYSSDLVVENIDDCTAWNLIFTNEMVEIIVKWTNNKLERVRSMYSNPHHAELQDTNVWEIKSFIGLLIFTSIQSSHPIGYFWSKKKQFQMHIFPCTMTGERFSILMYCLRFNDKNDRISKRLNDPIAHISELLQHFNRNSQNYYKPSKNVIISEFMMTYKEKMIEKLYTEIPKAEQYVKMHCLIDTASNYFYNSYVCTQNDIEGLDIEDQESEDTYPSQIIMKVVEPIIKSKRNVITDDKFTSLQIADIFKENDLTLVGLLKNTKRDIPIEFLPSKKRKSGDTKYGFMNNKVLVSCLPKRKITMNVLSTLHHDKKQNLEYDIPEIYYYYKERKYVMDGLNEDFKEFSSKPQITPRWPVGIFFKIIDMSLVNGFILNLLIKKEKPTKMSKSGKEVSDTTSKMYLFCRNLAYALVEPALRERVNSSSVPNDKKILIRQILAEANNDDSEEEEEEDFDSEEDGSGSSYECPFFDDDDDDEDSDES